MLRVSYSLLAVFALMTASACERVIDVGGAGDAGIDAGGADASMDAEADAYMPDSIYGPSATRDQFEKFARDISGRWYGIVTREDDQESMRVELDFQPDERLTQGEFYFVCSNADRCDPFGQWAQDEGNYVLKHLQAVDGGGVGAAMGFIAWRDDHDEVQVSFREMLLQRGGEVLSFRFNAVAFEDGRPRAEARTAILVRTKPDDSGVADGGPL